jgi:hypothetical protein
VVPDRHGARLDLDTARLAIAKDHWYADLRDALAHGSHAVDPRLEAAADAVHAGDLDTLRQLLWTAFTFGYTGAAEALARCGASVDNLCVAASLGDLEVVRGYFDAAGGLRTDVAAVTRIGAQGPEPASDLVVEYALIWAAAHDRRPVLDSSLPRSRTSG